MELTIRLSRQEIAETLVNRYKQKYDYAFGETQVKEWTVKFSFASVPDYVIAELSHTPGSNSTEGKA